MKYKEIKRLKKEEKIKRMVKVSHELPNNMLHMSKDINDYEYCLVHLMDAMGAESCAKLVYDKFNERMALTGGGRVKVVKVECWEADRNSSIYTEI